MKLKEWSALFSVDTLPAIQVTWLEAPVMDGRSAESLFSSLSVIILNLPGDADDYGSS